MPILEGLWASRIPELTADEYDYLVGRAEYIDRPIHVIWDAVEESHSYLDSVLYIEKYLLIRNMPLKLEERAG